MSVRRIFLAIPVPPEAAAYRELLQKANAHTAGIKWMRLHNLHLTMCFIGNVQEEEVERIVEVTREIIASQQPFTLSFEQIAFAPSRDPRMIWGRYHKHDVFTGLSASIHEALSGIVPSNKFYYKEPVPHITLARFHHKVYKENKIDLPAAALPALEVNAIELWESRPSPEGVKYESIMKFDLAR